jgi:hypothetical protein
LSNRRSLRDPLSDGNPGGRRDDAARKTPCSGDWTRAREIAWSTLQVHLLVDEREQTPRRLMTTFSGAQQRGVLSKLANALGHDYKKERREGSTLARIDGWGRGDLRLNSLTAQRRDHSRRTTPCSKTTIHDDICPRHPCGAFLPLERPDFDPGDATAVGTIIIVEAIYSTLCV